MRFRFDRQRHADDEGPARRLEEGSGLREVRLILLRDRLEVHDIGRTFLADAAFRAFHDLRFREIHVGLFQHDAGIAVLGILLRSPAFLLIFLDIFRGERRVPASGIHRRIRHRVQQAQVRLAVALDVDIEFDLHAARQQDEQHAQRQNHRCNFFPLFHRVLLDQSFFFNPSRIALTVFV